MKLEMKLGHHLICEATNCNVEILNDEVKLVDIMLRACVAGGAGILGHVSHKFSPQGATVVVGLSESHASIHTWPEYGYAMIDVCTCGDRVKPMVIFHLIEEELNATIRVREIERGIPKIVEEII